MYWCCPKCLATSRGMWQITFFAPPGAFPREADRGLCNFLHVTLRKNPNFSDFERLDGACSLDPRCLYSGSGLFRGYIERFSNFPSTPRRNFALAREIPMLHSLKSQLQRKSRSKPNLGYGAWRNTG